MIRAPFPRSCLQQDHLIFKNEWLRCALKHDLQSKSVSTNVSEAKMRVLELRAARADLTLSEWVRDALLGSSVDAGSMAPAPCAN